MRKSRKFNEVSLSEGKGKMFRSIVQLSLGVIVGVLTLGAMTLAGCSKGDTGDAGSNSGPGTQFVSDGGAGATLKLRVTGGNTLTAGSTTGFRVTATDPSGLALAFIQIFCESEHGIAIIEPSSNGVAFEMTDEYGNMSGVIGALTPGSFVLQCEANNGFGLIDRVSIKNVGDIPPGFAGFPGAAGGNLGGGVIVEDPTADVAISGFTLVRLGEEVSSLDTERALCLSSSGTCSVEPFGATSWSLTISNTTRKQVTSATISFLISGSASTAGPFSDTISIAPGGSATITGPMSTTGATFAITGDPVQTGTFATRATVTLSFEDGSTTTDTTTRTFTYGPVNGCASGESLATVAQCTP